MRNPTCPDCKVSMEGGFLPDRTDSSTGHAQSCWVEGVPEKSFWTGLKLKGKRRLAVYAWRCPRCALVRLYAPDG